MSERTKKCTHTHGNFTSLSLVICQRVYFGQLWLDISAFRKHRFTRMPPVFSLCSFSKEKNEQPSCLVHRCWQSRNSSSWQGVPGIPFILLPLHTRVLLPSVLTYQLDRPLGCVAIFYTVQIRVELRVWIRVLMRLVTRPNIVTRVKMRARLVIHG